MEQVKGNSGEINVLISSLSTINEKYAAKNVEQTYYMKSDNGDRISHKNGLFTNYPIIQLTRQKLASASRQVDYLFEISSPATKETVKIGELPEFSGKSVVEWLDKWLKESEDQEHGAVPEIVPFDISDDPSSEETIRIINDVRRKIEKIQQDSQKIINIYIDGQGGRRHTVYSLIMSVYIWEREKGSRIRLKEIFNLNFDQDKKVYWIYDYKERYNAVQLYSAIDEFINYGKSTALTSYMSPVMDRKIKDVDQDEQLKNDIQRCLDVMKLFSDDLQLCRSGKIPEDIKNFREVTERVCDRYSGIEDYYITSFITALEMIRKEFDALPEDADEVDVIRWCIDKDFIQQAITFCAERSIEYLLNGSVASVGNAFSDKEIEDRSDRGLYSPEYTVVNKMSDLASTKFFDLYENGNKSLSVSDVREKWNSLKSSKPENSKALGVKSDVESYCIKRIRTTKELKIIFNLINKFPFHSNRELDQFLKEANIQANGSSECFNVGNKKISASELLMKNTQYNLIQASQAVMGYLVEMREKKSKKFAKRIINGSATKKSQNNLITNQDAEYERAMGYLLFRKQTRKYCNGEKHREWFYDKYFSDLDKIIQKDNERPDVKKYLFYTVLKNNSVAALFDIGALRSDNTERAVKCIYWYKLIKAQRNLSNHASDTNGGADFNMTAEELKGIISEYLNLIKPENEKMVATAQN